MIHEGRCERGLSFNFETQSCDFEENVDCENPWVPERCSGSSNVTVIPHPYICSKYTVCFERIVNDRECPLGLHFSYFDGGCVDPRFADCQIDRKLCKESVDNNDLPIFIKNERNCGSYFLCVGEKAVLLRCAPGNQFDTTNNWCERREEVQCESSVPENAPTIPDDYQMECGGLTGTTIAHPTSCKFYFFCAGDRSYLQVCGDGLLYDVMTGRCQLEGNANCSVPIAPTTTQAPTSTVETTITEEITEETTDDPTTTVG